MQLKISIAGQQLVLVLGCVLLWNVRSVAQPNSVKPVFTIIHLPRSAGYTKQEINAEIKTFTQKDEIRNWIKRKNTLQQQTLIFKVAKDTSSTIYWTIEGKEKIEREQNYIAPMSKFTQSAKAFKLSDLNGFFKDTLVLFDTLAIELYLKEKNYPVDQFIISFSCRKKSQSIAIVNDDNKLIFSPNIFEPCAISEADIRITNKQNPQRNIANCRLIFLGEEQKEEIISFAQHLQEENPGKTSKEVILETSVFCQQTFGTPYFVQFSQWLSAQLKPE